MKFTEAQQAVIRRLQSMPGRPALAYPNMDPTPGLPRIVVQVSAQTGQTLTLDNITDATTEVIAQVEVENGQLADSYVQAICDRFPVGLRFEGLTIQQAPQPRPPFQGAGYQSTPVVIRVRHWF